MGKTLGVREGDRLPSLSIDDSAERLDAIRQLADCLGSWADARLFAQVVDSKLTSMVQMADLCGFAVRRYFENNETDLFDRIFSRFDRTPKGIVGIHHHAHTECQCKVCRQIESIS